MTILLLLIATIFFAYYTVYSYRRLGEITSDIEDYLVDHSDLHVVGRRLVTVISAIIFLALCGFWVYWVPFHISIT